MISLLLRRSFSQWCQCLTKNGVLQKSSSFYSAMFTKTELTLLTSQLREISLKKIEKRKQNLTGSQKSDNPDEIDMDITQLNRILNEPYTETDALQSPKH